MISFMKKTKIKTRRLHQVDASFELFNALREILAVQSRHKNQME